MALTISAEHWQAMLDHLRAALPAEGCGLLVCDDRDDGHLEITHIFPGRNVLASPTRFRMDPAEVIAAFRTMRERNLRLAAIFHSHPNSPPTLSATDLREAHYPEAAIVIVSFASQVPAVVAWRLERGSDGLTPEEIPVRVRPA
jgi:[CysO sulfur-carrier protein]-S-L-cysteine hydrolase